MFEFNLVFLSFYFILRNNGTAMAVLAAPLPAALIKHVEGYVGKRLMVMDVPAKRRKGRPKLRQMDSIKNDLTEKRVISACLIRVCDIPIKTEPLIIVNKCSLFQTLPM